MASFFLFFGRTCTYNKSCFRLVFVMLPYIIFRWWTSFFWLFLSYLYFLVFISYFLQCFKFFISANSFLPATLFFCRQACFPVPRVLKVSPLPLSFSLLPLSFSPSRTGVGWAAGLGVASLRWKVLSPRKRAATFISSAAAATRILFFSPRAEFFTAFYPRLN